MPSIDALLTAPDHFALLGLERRFDLDPADVEARCADLRGRVSPADGENGATLLARVEAARAVLSDLESRADYLLSLTGGPTEQQVGHLWAAHQRAINDLRGRWARASARNDPAELDRVRSAVAAEREAHVARIAALFRALRGHDNPVVQRDRRRDIRMALNALRELRGIAR